ncbi:hypothetical protein RB628_01040 [Streptomyces sp. ADMS]|nr:hypothetical protein [Streptomyces sp. ADMS]MDW4903964.1 hypothetical protein [Streptomyces sp. ADMS]
MPCGRDIEPYTVPGTESVSISPHLGLTSQWREAFGGQAVQRLAERG